MNFYSASSGKRIMGTTIIWLGLLSLLHASYGVVEYFTVSEEQVAGTFVGNITRRDTFTYYFRGQVDFFRIDPDHGSIFTTARIDREALISDDLKYIVVSSSPVYATEVTIRVLDINDNAPKFKSSIVNINVLESVKVGTLIPFDSATDPDLGQNSVASYSIVSGNSENKFAIEIIFGLLHLKVKSKLDRELKNSYSLNVSASDNGTVPKYGFVNLNIAVLDVNDNAPLFNPSTYRADIFENATIGTSLLQISATDQDVGVNGEITYLLKDATVFTINSLTGMISLIAPLDHETAPSIELSVQAFDRGNPPLMALATVSVTVKDVNDNKPLINTNGISHADLIENIHFQDFLFIEVSDVDFNPVALHIVSGNIDNRFSIRNFYVRYYFLTTNVVLDREEQDKYILTLRAYDSGNPQLTSDYQFTVNVLDKNDNKPVFEKEIYFAKIVEGAPFGSYVASVKASDLDTGLNSAIEYRISTGNYNNWFHISKTTGLITTNSHEIDYDILVNSSVILKVIAMDRGSPPLHAHTIVNITIDRANDNKPIFSQALYPVSVNESVPLNSVILNVSATDIDKSADGTIHYQFDCAPKVVTVTFNLNSLTGEISLQKALDYDLAKYYSFYVLATDSGDPQLQSKARVQITVIDADDHPPLFSSTSFHINAVGSSLPGVIGTFKALDVDSGIYGNIVYSVEAAGCCNYFTVNQATGMLNSTRMLSTGNRYDLVIIATSNGKTSRASISVVTVDSVSQNPAFTRDDYSFSVEENSQGVFVGKVEPVGGQSALLFSIEAGNELGFFRINDNGELFTQKGIDRELHAMFVLTVIARTNKTLFLTAKATVRISIKDLNDNEPVLVWQAIPGYSVREDAVIGEHVFTVVATDADYGKNAVLRYSMKPESKWMPFEIDSMTGSVLLRKSLINSSQIQYAINIEISDMGVPQQSTAVRFLVNMIDINDHSPEFSALHYDVIVQRNLSVNSRFFKFSAKDSDFGNNGKVLYEIQSGNTGNTFGIFPDGWLYLKAFAIIENTDYFLLDVKAYDQGSPRKSSAAKVSIFVERPNSKIFKTSLFGASVGENLPPGTFVANLSRNLEGMHSVLKNTTLKLLKGSTYFNIQPVNGVIRTKIKIDREAISRSGNGTIVSLVVAEQNTSNSTARETCIVVVEVSDDNDNGPVFEKAIYTAVISEASPAGTFVIGVKAVDKDSPSTSSIVYEIRPAQSHFGIDSSSGAIRIAASSTMLDYETEKMHNFTVIATDSKNSSLRSSCQVFIYITDYNDNKPVFTESTTSFAVSESTVVGSRLFTFTASDSDSGMNGFIAYSLSSADGQNVFRINKYSGELYLAGVIDFETRSSYRITISAADQGSPPLQETLLVNINIIDFNDNAPKFNTEATTLFVTENMPVPHIIGKCSASDADSGVNKVLRYTAINQGPVPGMFTVDANNCQITANTLINRELTSAFYIVIKAEDSAVNAKDRLSVTKNFTVLVEDVNDNVPVFVPPFAAGFSRTSGTGWEIIKITAIDLDAGLNGTVSYSINQKLDSAYFAVNRDTGSVTVIAPLANNRKTFQIEVTASDKGTKEQKHSTAIFHFFVTGTSSNAPVCSGTGLAGVYENLPVGTNVYRVQALSTEANSQMRYFLKSADFGNSFTVDPSSGWISTGRTIDFETDRNKFSLRVFAVESAGSVPRTTECSVVLNIQDLNDNAPVFASPVIDISVPENATVGYNVYQVRATDKDTGQHGVIDYAITSGNTLSAFAIGTSSGIVTLAKMLNRELIPSYELRIEASNKGSNQKSSAQLRVKISDINDNIPTFNQTFYSFTIPENSPRGSFVGTVSVSDADSGRNKEIFYEIVEKDQNTFAIDDATGVVRIANNVDYELIPNFMFNVRAIDYGNPRLSRTATVFVNIQDTNDNCPVFSNSVYTAEVEENLAPGTLVTTVHATDKDSGLNGQVMYEIVDGNTKNSFSSSANGDIHTKRLLDREETPSFKLLLRATDRGKFQPRNCLSYSTLTVKVLDVNDNSPVLTGPHSIRILESSSVGAVVFKFTATDRDYGVNSTIKFSFMEPNDLDRTFRLEENGNLLLLSRLDYEAKKEYFANISVSDHGISPRVSISKVTISIDDANDNNPIISPHPASISVMENATIGSTLIEFSATDLDSGDNARITYSIISGNLGAVFNIEPASGILYSEKAMNREERGSYLLEIEAKDNGLPQRRGITSLNVSLIDVNDCAPKFPSPSYNVSVPENVAAGAILTMQALDCDTGSNALLHYSLEESQFSYRFAMNPVTGTISLLQTLDREALSVVRLTITARDYGNPSLSGATTVLVHVLDENDNAPIITPRNVTKTVRENLNGDVEVQLFQITDSDFGLNSTIDVTLVDDFGSFRLRKAGDVYALRTIGGLDRELQDFYKLKIEASDRGVPKKSTVAYVNLFVADDNDHPPAFSKKRYEFKISSNAPVGSFVAQLATTDKDTKVNSNMQFAIISGNGSYVSIGADTGIILTKISIPLKTTFEIGVEVSDPTKPSFRDNSIVLIEATVGHPAFTHGELYGVVSEISPVGTFVKKVHAASNAIGPAATIRYDIHAGNIGLAFRIDTATGYLYVNNPLDYETTKAYSLWIEARDSKNPPQSSYVKCTFTVKNENDSAPIITGPKTNVLFMEEQGSNAYVTQVVAVDVDNPTSKARLRFRLGASGTSLPFSIDPINGKVRSTKSLDRETVPSYLLEVVAYPFENASLSTAYNLSILIQDDNDNKPVVHSPSRVSIPENLAVNSQVAVLNVTDKDEGANGLLRFYLTSQTFSIDVNTSRITLTRSLDRETRQTYVLNINVEDAAYREVHDLTIEVTDINDSPPYFQSSQILMNVSESTPVGSVFGHVSALDNDIGDNTVCFYHIEPRSGHGYVSVDPLSGSLRLKRKVKFVKDQSALNTLKFVLKARNIHSPFFIAQTRLDIQILDSNDHAPVFSQSSYHSYVESTIAIGHVITTVLAIDKYDVGQNAVISYSILSGNGSAALMLSGNSVKVKSSLHSFVNSVLQLVVQAADHGTPIRTSTALVNVKVTEENRHSPVFVKAQFEATFPENKQVRKELIKVVAVDQDNGENGLLFYSIKSGNTDDVFAIDANSGSLYLAKALDFEKRSLYGLVIEAKDGAKVNARASTVNVAIKVTDVNDNRPVFAARIFTATVVENSPSNTHVTKVIATDADSSDTISYDISDPTSRVYFTIDSNTGIIKTRTGIDYETNQKFTVVVTASDSGSPTLTSSVNVIINVIGVNEYSPRFVSKVFNFEVSQHARVDTIIGNVSAIDNDKGIDGVMVFIPRFSIDRSPFKLHAASGNLLVKRPLTTGRYALPIFVKDVLKINLTPSDIDEATIYVDVLKGNQPPEFTSSSYNTSVEENSPSGQSVITVSAIDNNARLIKYSLVKQLPSEAFSIDQTTGRITVSSHIDRERTPQYELTVQATDSGSPSAASTKVHVTIIDKNDNQPVIVNCRGSIPENASVGAVVGKLNVTDGDIDPNRGPFTYSTSATDFSVNASGVLQVARRLDREKLARYNITIDIVDNGSPAQHASGYCLITVIDVSDVKPTRRNVFAIYNNLGPYSLGGLIGNLSPYDPDHSDSYACVIETAHSIFHFEPSSCILHVASHRNIGYKTVNFTARSPGTELRDSMSVHFVPIINSTINRTLVIRLQGFYRTVLDFTNRTLLTLNQFLESISPSAVKIQVIGYKQQDPMTLDLLLVLLDKQSFNSLPVTAVNKLISDNAVRLQEITGSSSIIVPFKACNKENLCQNNATCYEFRSVDNHHKIWNSVGIIFVGVSFQASFACKCKPGYYGSRCEKIISSCTPNPCQNGGKCDEKSSGAVSNRSCSCPVGYAGKYCENDVDECVESPCKNSGTCMNTPGSYYCQCGAKYTGKNCENVVNFCQPNPCLFGGACTPTDSSFTCNCKFGNQGKYCEINPMTFEPLSYLSFKSFPNHPLNISLDFATYDSNSLLLYGFHRTIIGTKSPFVGFELVNGQVRFSYNFGKAVKRSSIDLVQVADGHWHTASAFLSGRQKLLVRVDKTTKEFSMNEATQTPDLQGAPLYIAGVPSVDVILQRPNQISVEDFTGCMRNIHINGYHVDRSTAETSSEVTNGCTKAVGCSVSACSFGQCINDWKGFQCQCSSGFAGDTCSTDAKPFTFGGTSFVMFKLKESYRRKLQMALSTSPLRRKRSTVISSSTTNSFSIEFRTRNPNGLLLFAEDVGGNFTVLHISNGGVHYKFDLGSKGSGATAIEKPLVNDGKWHNISLIVTESKVSLSLDNNQATQNSFSVPPHRFYSVHTDTLSIAGTATPKSIDGRQLANFHGCLNAISLNNANLGIRTSNKFNVTTVGSTLNSCAGSKVCVPNPCLDPVKSYCIDDWEAYRCIDPGKCKARPCKNGGTCIPNEAGFSCNCIGNFTGSLCETPLACLQSPCKMGEACIANENTVFMCVPIVTEKGETLSTAEVVIIVVFTLIGLVLIVMIIFVWRKRQPFRTKRFKGDFVADGGEIELKHTIQAVGFGNGSFETNQSSELVEPSRKLPPNVIVFDNEAYQNDVNDVSSAGARWKLSTSQPSIQPPRSLKMHEHVKNANRSLPILSYSGDQHSEQRRNERILQDLRGTHLTNEQIRDITLEAQARRSSERLMEVPIPSKLGTATPPFESGFESTGSDVDSERDQVSMTDVVDGSSQLEMYDLEVASIGFSEMSWQNDNNSASSRDIRRDFIDKRLDRLRHVMPQFNIYDYGSMPSDRHTRSDRVSDRLSDLIEQDSSSDSDGSFTGSEYEYGDERISTNKLSRKHLVFSRHPQTSDSEVEGGLAQRRHSSDSSITNMTDVGSMQPTRDQRNAPSFAMPPIDWDQLLNWAMKYQNLSDVYRDLAALREDDERENPRVSSARSSNGWKRNQKLLQQPVKFHSAQELHQAEEYV